MDDLKKQEEQSSTRMFVSLGIILFLVILVRGFILEVTYLGDNSMVPTFNHDEYLLINRLAYASADPIPGDLVSVRLTERRVQHTVITVKRVVAVGGQTVEIKDGKLIVDGKVMPEPYLSEQGFDNYGPVQVPENHFFVLGDNRNYSTDSRSPEVGPISSEAVRGKVFYVVWPLKSVRSI